MLPCRFTDRADAAVCHAIMLAASVYAILCCFRDALICYEDMLFDAFFAFRFAMLMLLPYAIAFS